MRKIKGCDWSGWLCWIRNCSWLDFTSSASADGKVADPTFGSLVWWGDADTMLLGEVVDSSPSG